MNLADGVIAGGMAGVIVETALYPIDTIKTRIQAGELQGWIYHDRNEDWGIWHVTLSTTTSHSQCLSAMPWLDI